MRPDSYSARGEWAIAIAMVVGVAVALALFFQIQEAGATQRSSRSCGDVVVQFHPEGSGGAHAIQATGIGCEPARNVARSCVKGTVLSGWTATTWDGKVQLTKDGKRIRYTGVGGGGCGFQQQSCQDFSYRGVGFFGPESVGISCGGARSKAKAWYDRGGACSFGSTCEVSRYSCTANPSTATVTCTRQNGFRFRWQMGE